MGSDAIRDGGIRRDTRHVVRDQTRYETRCVGSDARDGIRRDTRHVVWDQTLY